MKTFDQKRRSILKFAALFAAVPFVDTITNRGKLLASGIEKFTTSLVTNGEVVTGAHWGMLKLTIKDGKIVKSAPYEITSKIKNPLQEVTDDLVYAKDRIKYPMVRKSYLANPNSPKPELRGGDEWVRVSYDEAIKLIANELKKTRKQKGNNSIFAGAYGWKSSGNMHNSRTLLHRFMKATGGFIGTLGDYSSAAAQIIMPHVVGTLETYEQQTSWPLVLENSKVVVLWGANPLDTLKIAWTVSEQMGFKYFEELKNSKIKVICIDPVKTSTCEYLNAQWIAPNPNTDVALMLGVAYELYESKKYNAKFIEEYTEGFDKFLPYLLGKTDKTPKTPKWASSICDVDEKIIKQLAHTIYDNRTMLMSGWGMQRAHHGEQPHWMLVTLASMLGQIGLAGGGFGLSYHYSNGGSPTAKASIVGGITIGNDSGAGAEWLNDASNSSFPVARIADALLNPGATIDFNGRKITYPDIDFIYWVGGNPLVHHQDTNRLIKAWRKPRTIVVNEFYWTPTARMADIVMPTTTSYERDDISMSGDYSNLNIVPMKQAVKAQFEAKSDYEIFSSLAKEFGVYEQYTENKTPLEWIESFYNKAYDLAKKQQIVMPTFRDFWKANKPITFDVPYENTQFIRYADFIEDPILSPLGTPSGKIEIYSSTIEKMKYDDCKPHPTWLEPVEWVGMKNKPAQFALVSPHPALRLHSQLNNTRLRDKYAVNNREPIWINTADAKEKGIKSGDLVRVFNKRGQILTGAIVTDGIKQGSVKIQEGAWYAPEAGGQIGTLCTNGNANVLTIDIPTSKLASGNIAHTALVNIEKFKGKAPKLNIFNQPLGA